MCKYLKPIEAGNLINGLRYQVRLLEELPDVYLSEDPDDNPLLVPVKWITTSAVTSGMCWP